MLLVLLGTTLVIAAPILRGGYLTYLDNPVHIAEIYELAGSKGGWSELGFAGFPLGTLHSPLFYPALAALVRLGVPLHPLYAALLIVGFLAPSLAIYKVARTRTGPGPAGLLAYLTLVQPSVVWGIGSPLGGMWTMGIASAAVIFLAELLTRPALDRRGHFVLAALATFAALTHLFVLPLLALLALVTTAMHRRAGVLSKDELNARAVAFGVAALASAKYWLTTMWVADVGASPPQAFRPLDILCRLFLPADSMYLLADRIRESFRDDASFVDCAPAFLLLGLGIAGYVMGRRPEPDPDDVGPLVRMGFWFATAVAVTLVVNVYVPLRFLGPVSWRLIDWIRIGLTFSAIGAVSSPRLAPVLSGRGVRTGAAAVLGVGLGYLWGTSLRHDSPTEEMAHELVRADSLWTWLRRNAKKDWGRIYLQDTFGVDWLGGGMALSHLLALTSHHTGLDQLGTYYGVVPYKLRWTLSEFGTLFSTADPAREWVVEAMGKVNAGVLVTSNLAMSERVARMDAFDQLYAVGRYSVWRLRDARNAAIAELSPANHVSNVESTPGDLRFDLTTDYSKARVLAKVAYHRWWRVDGAGEGSWVRESPEGFLVVDDIPQGKFHVRLTYAESPVPGRLSAIGLGLLGAWGVALSRRRRSLGVTPA